MTYFFCLVNIFFLMVAFSNVKEGKASFFAVTIVIYIGR